MLNKKHSFIDDFLNNYYEFLKDYDNLDYKYTAKTKGKKREKLKNGKDKEAIEDILKEISFRKFHISYGFYTFLDAESNKITHLYSQFNDGKLKDKEDKFIPVPLSNTIDDSTFTTIFNEFHQNETQIFWNLPDAYRVNNWIFGHENYIHEFYENTITQKLNKDSAYNIILSEEILFFLYGKYFLEGKTLEKISSLLKLDKNYSTTTQITPNLKQLIKFACSVEAKVCKQIDFNNYLKLKSLLWNKGFEKSELEEEQFEVGDRKQVEQLVDNILVETNVTDFIKIIHPFITNIIRELIQSIVKSINNIKKNEKFVNDFQSLFNITKSNECDRYYIEKEGKLWQKIARFNFEISEQLIDKDETNTFHDILLFPILKSSTGTFESNTFFYKNCIENNESVKIEVPFVMTCYITTLYGLDKSLLDEDEESLNGFNITMEVCKNFAKPIVDELFYAKLINARIKPAATRAAISQVMARNTSHNIGAHVMNKLVDADSLKDLDVNKFEWYNAANNLPEAETEKFTQIAYFNNYVKCRMDYLADITFGTPMMQTNRYALEDLYKEFDKVRLLLENISGLSDFKYRIEFKKNNELLKSENDLLIAIPNDLLGMQAFYNILENIIRNTAKHSTQKPIETVFTVNFRDKVDGDLKDNELIDEQKNVLNDLIIVEVYDNVIVESDVVAENIGTVDEQKKYKEILTLQNWGVEAITPTQKIDWLVYHQNNKLNADILEDNKLRTGSLGVVEMDASAAYLRKRDVSLINHDNYNVKHEPFCSCESTRNKGNNRGKYCRNFLKAIKKEVKDVEYKNSKKTGSVLGYRFFLLRPEVVLVVTDNMLEINKKDELKKAGVWLKTNEEFQNDLVKGEVYNHDFVVHDGLDKITVENTNILEYYKTSLPIRVLQIGKEEIEDELNKDIFSDDSKKQTNCEKFCWDKWHHNILKTNNINDSQWEIAGNPNPTIFHNIVLLDHLYIDDIKPENRAKNAKEKWGKYKGAFHVEALTSLAQGRMPNFFDITKGEKKQNDKFKIYNGNINGTIASIKILDAVLSKVIVLDERIQEAAEKRDFMSIFFKELYPKMNVTVPSIDLNLSTNSYTPEIINQIEDYITKQIRDTNNTDFILIHYSILERMYKKEDINKKLLKLIGQNPINIVITSGRGIPENLDPKMRFVNLSSVISAFVEFRSKYVITGLLNSSRKIKFS